MAGPRMIPDFLKKRLKHLGCYYFLQYQVYRLRQLILQLQLQYRYRSHKGSGFCCNHCGARYAAFAPWYPSKEDSPALQKHQVIAGYGDQCICPACLSTSRERLVLGMLEQDKQWSGKRVLHIAPEKRIYGRLIKEAVVTTADAEPGFYQFIDPKIKQENLCSLSFESSSFELVIANHVLEHIVDDRAAMREVFRVLVPGGRAMLQVPYSTSLPATLEDETVIDPANRSKLFGQRDHVRIYQLNDYCRRLRETGFSVILYTEEQLASLQSNAIQPKEVFFHIQKPIG